MIWKKTVLLITMVTLVSCISCAKDKQQESGNQDAILSPTEAVTPTPDYVSEFISAYETNGMNGLRQAREEVDTALIGEKLIPNYNLAQWYCWGGGWKIDDTIYLNFGVNDFAWIYDEETGYLTCLDEERYKLLEIANAYLEKYAETRGRQDYKLCYVTMSLLCKEEDIAIYSGSVFINAVDSADDEVRYSIYIIYKGREFLGGVIHDPEYGFIREW